MRKDDFYHAIQELPVWDTHTHLDTSEHVCAQSFWDIAHYFWYNRELEGAGYPLKANELPASKRFEKFLDAYKRNRNTSWNRQVARACNELYGIEIRDKKSLVDLDEKIRATARDPSWAGTVCAKAGISRIVVGPGVRNQIDLLGDRPLVVPIIGPGEALRPVTIQSIEDHSDSIRREISDLTAKGVSVVRAEVAFSSDSPWAKPSAEDGINDLEALNALFSHVLLEELASRNIHVQLFIGMRQDTAGYTPKSGSHQSFALNDPAYLARLHPIFDLYGPAGDTSEGCTFEIVNGAEQSALDIVQAARIYRNVYPGGLWWFNFRASTYRANMQYRLEGLSALRSMLIASDARCIEWSYIKITFVKRILAEFLFSNISEGWIDEETALFVAKSWLYDTASSVY